MDSPNNRYKNKSRLNNKSRSRSNHDSNDTNMKEQYQSLAKSLIVFIFVIYGLGFMATVVTLPPLNPQEVMAFKAGNNLASLLKDGSSATGSDSGSSGSGGGNGGSGAGSDTSHMKGVALNIAKKGLVRVQEDTQDSEDSEDSKDREEADKDDDTFQPDDQIPKPIWPVSVTTDKSDWLEIPHPGDSDIKMTVPPFWSKPIHNKKLMTWNQAMSIGSCATPDPTTGSFQRADACPLEERTIFVAIASYRDWQCRYTIESIFTRAKYPHRIRVGVVDQIVEGDDICNVPIDSCEEKPDQALCKYISQVDNYVMDAPLSVGPVFARHIGHRLYRGEYYSMQNDAHVTFTQDWDVDIIEQQEATRDDMAVLTTYLTDIVGSIDEKTGKSLRKTRPIMCNTDYEGGIQGKHLRHMSQPERLPPARLKMPQLEPYWAAGFSFSRGHFVVNVPYDLYQPMIFQGEEMSIGIRGFTIGYDYFSPQRSVCFHHYASQDTSHKRDNVPKFWENANKYSGIGKKSMARLLGIVKMNPEVPLSFWDHTEEDMYGLGGVRTPEKFYTTFGIDVVKKTTHKRLCSFVDTGKMHDWFMPKLRSDGIGIDYSTVKYKH